MHNEYHFVLCQVADALSDSRADEVGSVTQEDGAARLGGGVTGRFTLILFICLHGLKTLLYLQVSSRHVIKVNISSDYRVNIT